MSFFCLWSKCVVSSCCEACLGYMNQYSSSFTKCFSLVTELLKCEGYVCVSEWKLSNWFMCCNSTGKAERGEQSWQCWALTSICATYWLWDICLCLISARLFFLSVERVSLYLALSSYWTLSSSGKNKYSCSLEYCNRWPLQLRKSNAKC